MINQSESALDGSGMGEIQELELGVERAAIVRLERTLAESGRAGQGDAGEQD